jgi:hypothetical protein
MPRPHPIARYFSFGDALIFAFTASLMLWPDLPPAAVILVLAVMLGATMVTVASERGAR